MTDFHESLTAALARTAAPAERFAAVLAEHEYAVGPVLGGAPMICRCGAVRKPAHDEPLQDLHRAHVAAALAAVADDGLAKAWGEGYAAAERRYAAEELAQARRQPRVPKPPNPYRPAPEVCSTCGGTFDSPPCSLNRDIGLSGHTRSGGVAAALPAPSADRDERDGV